MPNAAGKKLEYDVEIKSELKDVVEKVKAAVNYFTGLDEVDIEAQIKEKEAEVILKKKFDLQMKTRERIAAIVLQWINEVEKIKFVDVYSK